MLLASQPLSFYDRQNRIKNTLFPYTLPWAEYRITRGTLYYPTLLRSVAGMINLVGKAPKPLSRYRLFHSSTCCAWGRIKPSN